MLGDTGRAAQLAAAFTINGYADWFLPSKDELNQMYRFLKLNMLGNFSNNGYWSSSQANNDSAWHQSFGGGSQGSASKVSPHSVRVIRAF
jgi:hypothetical protein